MRVILLALFVLSGCGAMDAFENARSPAEAYYLLKKKDDDKSANPYDHDPKYRPVYCTVDGAQFRATAATCTEAKGTATPVR